MSSIGYLRELLSRVEPEREIWFAPGRGSVCARDVDRFVANSRDALERVRDHNVALYAGSEVELAPLLVLLDGTCRQLTLLPANLPRDRLAEIVVRSQSEILVTTDRQAVARGEFEICQVDAERLWGGWDPTPQQGRETAPQQAHGRWVLPTSGTTGEPKLVAHTLASLTRTAKHDLTRGQEYRWGSLYNLTGFAGLQVFLQSWCGGSCLILGRETSLLEERVADLIEGGCTALSATPTMWRKLLMSCPVERLTLKQITLGGEIVDQKILDALRRAFPRAKITHIYASTEAGVGFAVRDGRAGFPASYVDNPPPGIRLAVDPQGLLLLRSDCDEQEYIDRGSELKRDDEFVDTGDLVTRRDDRFFFLGRANGTINVGGNKVHPEEVENFLLGCDGVQLARVTGRKSPFTGQLVQAEVVLESTLSLDPDEFKKALLARCRAELDAYKVPAVLKFVEQIESTTSGKLKRTE
jgi:acyl-CoA synthetase (AMP-forming)/AMP-acid ligase II